MLSAVGERLRSRDNNIFNLLRLLAALGVIITHSYSFLGKPEHDLLFRLTNGLISFSRLGVYVFFIISGFLIAGSLENSKSLTSFFWKRFLRIFPALVVVVALAVLVLGPLVTNVSLATYFTSPATYRYLGGLVLYRLTYNLPGVFATNLYPHAVNGSLWTLPYEWTCYLVLAVCYPAIKKHRYVLIVLLAILCMVLRTVVGSLSIFPVVPVLHLDTRQFLLYAFLFLLGSVAQQTLELIPYKGYIVVVLMLSLALVNGSKLATYWLLIILPYVVLYLAAVQLPQKIRAFFNKADFSYGMYIYAFPVGQMLVHFFAPHLTTTTLATITIIATLPLAAASWYCIERPALRFKTRALFASSKADVNQPVIS